MSEDRSLFKEKIAWKMKNDVLRTVEGQIDNDKQSKRHSVQFKGNLTIKKIKKSPSEGLLMINGKLTVVSKIGNKGHSALLAVLSMKMPLIRPEITRQSCVEDLFW